MCASMQQEPSYHYYYFHILMDKQLRLRRQSELVGEIMVHLVHRHGWVVGNG